MCSFTPSVFEMRFSFDLIIQNDAQFLSRRETMPKIKTNRAAAKRFKKTGSGRYTFSKSHHSHILTTKSRKRKRSLKKMQLVKKSDMREVRLLLPNG
jgi:large subunit ribosomal protein L35